MMRNANNIKVGKLRRDIMVLTKKKIILIVVLSVFSLLVIAGSVTAGIMLSTLKGEDYSYQWSSNQEFNKNTDTFEVEKTVGEEFEILQLTDIQLWSNGADNKKAFEVANKIIDTAKPDLVVLTGDNVSGAGIPSLMKDLIEFMEKKATEHNFLWAPVYGNHDSEMRVTKNWLGDQFNKVSVANGGHCLFKKGPTNLGDNYGENSGNFVINVVENNVIVQSLYMLDNSNYTSYSDEIKKANNDRTNQEIPITYSQIAWYKWNAKNINAIAGKKVPQLTFCHFAPVEAGEAFDRVGYFGADKKADKEGGVQDDLPRDNLGKFAVIDGDIMKNMATYDNDATGTKVTGYGYRPGTALINTGFVDVAKDLGLKGMFFGHDHESDAVIEYEGVIYGYGLKVGPSPRPWNGAAEFGGTSLMIGADSNNLTITHMVSELAGDYWDEVL